MNLPKSALLACAMLAAAATAGRAEDIDALKAQADELSASIAAMEAATLPEGASGLSISKGDFVETPGLAMSPHDRMSYGDKATVLSVIPQAGAPARATVTWSGEVMTGIVYQHSSGK